MRLIAKLFTSEHRGDHDADICRLYDIGPDETVYELAERLRLDKMRGLGPRATFHDWIEIRILHEHDGDTGAARKEKDDA